MGESRGSKRGIYLAALFLLKALKVHAVNYVKSIEPATSVSHASPHILDKY